MTSLPSTTDGGVEIGMQVSEDHLLNRLGMCSDPVTGNALGRQPNRLHLPLTTWTEVALGDANGRPTMRMPAVLACRGRLRRRQ